MHNERHENLRILVEEMKIMKIIELHLSHEKHRIPSEHHENHENLKFHMRITKIMKMLE